MGFVIKASLADALMAEDVRPVYAQPGYGGGRYRDNDPNYEPERTQEQVVALMRDAGASVQAGTRSMLNNTGAPPAPHAGNHGDMTGMMIVRQTLARF